MSGRGPTDNNGGPRNTSAAAAESRPGDQDDVVARTLEQAAFAEAAEPGLGLLFEDVQGRISQERGLRAWVREQSTRWRLTVGFVVLLAVAGAGGLFTAHSDLERALSAVALLATGAWALMVSLRPLHRPPISPAVTGALTVAAVGVPLCLAFVLGDGTPATLSTAAASSPFAAMHCFGIGSVCGLAVLAGWGLLSRTGFSNSERILLGAAMAGLVGNLFLQLKCVVFAPGHRLFGHVSIVFFLVLGVSLWLRVRSRDTSS